MAIFKLAFLSRERHQHSPQEQQTEAFQMNKYTPDYAHYIKAKLVDYILSEHDKSKVVIATEVPVSNKNSIIDMMLIGENFLIGYEIKSKFDSTFRLKKQFDDYRGHFNALYLVCPETFKFERNELSRSTGILTYHDKKVELYRAAKARSYPEKSRMINFLWKRDFLPIPNNANATIEQLRAHTLKKENSSQLFQRVCSTLQKRYKSRYQSFLSSRGERTFVQDIDVLSMTDAFLC